EPTPQRRAHRTVDDDEAEGAQPLLRRVEARESKAAAVGNMDTANCCRFALQQRPDAQRIEDAPAAVGQCRGPIVEARLPERAERMSLDQDDVESELGQRQRERRADETAAADGDVTLHDLRVRARFHSSASRWRRRLSERRW